MIWVVFVFVGILFAFSFVLAFGAPYLPTLDDQRRSALDLLDLKSGQVLLELGSGDGRILAAAAEQGIRAIGYELNPLLVFYSRVRLRHYGDLATVRFGNFWNHRLPECDGIYVFLLDRYMKKMYTKITQEISNSVKLVSFAFQIPKVKHITEKNGLYLYILHNSRGK